MSYVDDTHKYTSSFKNEIMSENAEYSVASK